MAIDEAWIIFTVAGGAITARAGKNVTSVGYNAAGDYSVNLKDDLVSATSTGTPDTLGILPFATIGGVSAVPALAGLVHIKCEVVDRRQIRVRCRDVAGALADVAEVTMQVRADPAPASE